MADKGCGPGSSLARFTDATASLSATRLDQDVQTPFLAAPLLLQRPFNSRDFYILWSWGGPASQLKPGVDYPRARLGFDEFFPDEGGGLAYLTTLVARGLHLPPVLQGRGSLAVVPRFARVARVPGTHVGRFGHLLTSYAQAPSRRWRELT